MLLNVIYSLLFAVTAGLGRKGLRHFRPYPDVIFLGERVIRSVYACKQVAAVSLISWLVSVAGMVERSS